MYVYIWLHEDDGYSKVIPKYAGNIVGPFQIPRIDIRQRRLPTDNPIHIAYHGLV